MIKAANEKSIAEAAGILKAGGLVGMPTETVYGLAANALNGNAVAKIFAVKGRPSFNPLIIHVPNLESAEEYVQVNDAARKAAHHFWPGPLTLILPRKSDCEISELASAGLETLAVRVPGHKVALALLKQAGVPVAAPSANKSGSLSPTSPAHVHEQLGDQVDLILAAGPCAVGLESTVLDLSGDKPEILRPGAVTAEQICEVLGFDIAYEQAETGVPKSPGMLLKHYAPETPVRLNAIDVKEGEALLVFGSDKFMVARDFPEGRKRNLSETQDLYEAAANLFAMLKELDGCGAKAIAVMAIPESGIGVAINDRLRRAAQT
ncbi:MAG: L-threonylcarbamoyladenylate synthase [Alphaproteobacteria bacterium]